MKKNEELLHSMGDIEEKYIENAKPRETIKRKIIWISAVSAAACLVVTIGLTYYFMIRPINDINNNGNTPDSIITEITTASEPPQTNKYEDLSRYPDIKEIDLNGIREMCGINVSNDNCEIRGVKSSGENIFIQDIHDSTRENWCLAAEISSLDKQIVFSSISNITMNEIYGSDACFNDTNLYILLHGRLFSVSLDTDEIIAQKDGFHFEMDLSGYSKCLGADNDGNLYMESGDYADNNRILKYNPQLELISEYQTGYSIPFEHIINFDDMYINSDDVLCCVYDGEKTVSINLSDEKISCEEEIIKDGAYWYINNNKEDTLKTYTTRYQEDNSGVRYSDGEINCINSEVILSVNAGRGTSFIKLDKNGEFIKEYSMSEKYDPICYGFDLNENNEIISAFPYESDGVLSDHITRYNMENDKSDILEIMTNEYYKDSGIISINDFGTDNSENFYFSYLFSDKLKGSPSQDYPLISRYSKNNYNEQVTVKITKDDAENLFLINTQILINNDVPYVIAVSKSGQKSAIYKPDFENKTYSKVAEVSGKLFSQSDGTILCILDNILYSYELVDGKMTEIFELPQEVLVSDNNSDDIQKINENCYAYIKGLAVPQSDQKPEVQLYLLTASE